MVQSSFRLTDLIDLETLQRIQDAFAEATGVASLITEADGRPLTRPSNFCRLCNLIRACPKGLANCMHSDAVLGKQNPEGPIMQPCLSGGLWDGGASIQAGSVHLANWLIGQVRNETQSEEAMLAYARDIGADEATFLEALREVPAMSTPQFAKVCEALFLIANQMSDLAYHNLALRQSESSLKTTLDSIGDAVIATDREGRVTRMNPVAEQLTGWRLGEALGQPLAEVFHLLDSESGAPMPELAKTAIACGETLHLERPCVLRARDGSQRPIADSASPIRAAEGDISGAVLVFRDVSEHMMLEERLRHSQKMDAIGQLAGGVAHDFNNLLQSILLTTDLLGEDLPDDPNLKHMVDTIATTARKAAQLTQRLLDFSRKGKTHSEPMDVHEVIRVTQEILERSLDRRITLELDLQAPESHVLGDAAQLQNALLNLGINARDAMPGGGTLRFRTRKSAQRLDTGEPAIELRVEDTGEGIPPEILPRIFEPFFTTKEPGRGTGLGLPSVYGAVGDHHGRVQVESEVGKGTTFSILLPLLPEVPEAWMAAGTIGPEDVPQAAAEGAWILVVDDEPILREVAAGILRGLGYRVLEAADGFEAESVFGEHREEIALVLLDMVMPRRNGREAFQVIQALNPSVPVVFTSGFTRDQAFSDLLQQDQVHGFLPKPYGRAELAAAVSRALKGQA